MSFSLLFEYFRQKLDYDSFIFMLRHVRLKFLSDIFFCFVLQDMTSSSKTTSIRPFKCSICGRRSNWKCDIRKHYRQVHPQRMDARVILMTKEDLLEAGRMLSESASVK